jgi:hypothetical protein
MVDDFFLVVHDYWKLLEISGKENVIWLMIFFWWFMTIGNYWKLVVKKMLSG